MIPYSEKKIKENIKTETNKFIDYTGLFFIGILSVGYLLYYRSFAKLHIDLIFIKAPFFVSDITFAVCGLLFFLKWLMNRKNFNIFTYLFLFYCGFVVIKTIVGYINWGPLSLRHAVLFCYPIFAIFSYSFYRNDFFEPKMTIFLIVVFIFILKFCIFHLYFSLTLFIITLILINAYPVKLIKYTLYFLLLLVFPYKLLFNTSRTFMTANLLAMMYISFSSLFISKIKSKYKFIFLLLFLLFVFLGLTKGSRPNEVESLVRFKGLMKRYNETKELIRVKELAFVPLKLGIKLYNEESEGAEKKIKYNSVPGLSTRYDDKLVAPPVLVKNMNYQPKSFSQTNLNKEKKEEISIALDEKSKEADITIPPREIEVAYSTSIFRILIWKDVFKELKTVRPLFGFNFGKPFRSQSLEITGNAIGEWSRDGWICLHNSYVDIVYRAGIVGILMVAFILIMLFSLIKISFRNRSLAGILLTGILINWFIAANFLEILEMPYSAIPLWSLFGLTSAYLFKNKTV
ncbi:MAG: hypothetical protein NTW18_00915 [Candidatus Omnitrophica bacterium]|nr:hypothetical protein [Candidatus Omnitrophota bacterium]